MNTHDFGKALWGFDPHDVEQKISEINYEFEKTVKALNKKIGQLNSEIENFEDRHSPSKDDSRDNMLKQIADQLLSAHIETTKKVYDASLKARKIEEEKHQELMTLEENYNIIKDALRKCVDDIQKIAHN